MLIAHERGQLQIESTGMPRFSFWHLLAERRIHERVLVDLEVDYKADDTFLFAYITDISAMGIFIRTNAPEPPGTNGERIS